MAITYKMLRNGSAHQSCNCMIFISTLKLVFNLQNKICLRNQSYNLHTKARYYLIFKIGYFTFCDISLEFTMYGGGRHSRNYLNKKGKLSLTVMKWNNNVSQQATSQPNFPQDHFRTKDKRNSLLLWNNKGDVCRLVNDVISELELPNRGKYYFLIKRNMLTVKCNYTFINMKIIISHNKKHITLVTPVTYKKNISLIML